jgi:lysophospholipase L1-like esterase
MLRVLQTVSLIIGVTIIVLIFPTSLQAQNNPPAACWPLNETSSGTYDDVLGANDGVCAGNCPTPVSGRVAGAQTFGNSGVGVDVAATTPFNWEANDSFTIELWMQGVAGQTCKNASQVFVGRDDRNSGLQWWLGCARSSGVARFQLLDAAGQGITIDGSVVNDGGWHHVVAVRDGGSAVNRLYVDGVEQGVGAFSYSSGFASADAALNLGWFNHRRTPGFRFRGALDEVATYNRALTPTEIQEQYTNGLTGVGYCTTGSVAPTITSPPVTMATVGQAYSYDVAATGAPAPTYALLTAPPGMTVDVASGVIAWTPTAAGTFAVTVQASNSTGATSQQFTITVNDPTQVLTFSSTPVTTATAGQNYSYDANANGLPAPTYALLQAPSGMSIDAGTGVITWQPATNGVYNVTVRASNGVGVGTQSFIVQVKSTGVCTAPVRIMPLGDSITRGSGTNPVTGYRQPLYLALTAANYSVDFVGSVQNGETAQPAFDPHHEGHSGYRDDLIAAHVYQWLIDNPAEVVLLHAGTNDLSLVPPDNTPDDIVAILNEIDRFNPQTIVVLARIINRQTYSPETHQFNLDLAVMVAQRIAAGDKIVLVDQESALSYPADLTDNLHPNSTGYQKMATVWLDALDNFLQLCQPTAPTITSTPITAATVGQPYSYDVEANSDATYTLVSAPAGMTIDALTGLIAWTPTAADAQPVVVQATNNAGSATQSFTINVIAPVTLYLSTNSDGAIGGVNFADEDILAYNMATGGWALYFDGSDVGLSSIDVTAFTLLDDGTLLLSLDAALDLPGAGRVEIADVVRFVPTALGDTTAGSFALYFDGSALGLPGIDGLGLSSLGLSAALLTSEPGATPGAAEHHESSGSGTNNTAVNAMDGTVLSHRLFLPVVKR